MSPNPEIELKNISGIGPKYQLALNKLGIFSVHDLIYFLPKRIIDLTNITPIDKVKSLVDKEVVIEARVRSVNVVRTKIKKMWVVEAILEDESSAIQAIWFNQPYLFKFLKQNKDLKIYKATVNLSSKKIFLNNPEIYPKKGLYPIYRQTKNLSSRIISRIINKILIESLLKKDLLPAPVRKKNNLPILFDAAKLVHFPGSIADYKLGKYRFLFEELFLFMLVNLKIKTEFDSQKSPVIKSSGELKKLSEKLPFKLTQDQNETLADILEDFKKKRPMNRIIQGDVGSGKTVVAFLAALEAVLSGFQVAVLAPTEILAMQHFETFQSLATGLNFKINLSLVTSKTKKIASNENIIIGTHSLFNYKFKNLGLIIIDEQQRFGVEQRSLLLESHGYMPHYLSLSATPIPRTLAHVVFANCDLSVIKEKPKGRQKVDSFLIPENKRQSAYEFVDKLLARGQQAFVICPLIVADGLYDDKKSVESEMRNIKKSILGKRRIASLHGKMKIKDKEKVILDFRRGEIDILVSTSVVEVGVDIPKATAMIIEDAQMFGLSQLHQFRGRVGRSDLKSYCFLFAKIENEITKKRLKAFIQNDDGFELSSYDLKLRGPGSMFDISQSGFSNINPLWFENSKLLDECSRSAKEVLDELDKYPNLKEEINSKISVTHLD